MRQKRADTRPELAGERSSAGSAAAPDSRVTREVGVPAGVSGHDRTAIEPCRVRTTSQTPEPGVRAIATPVNPSAECVRTPRRRSPTRRNCRNCHDRHDRHHRHDAALAGVAPICICFKTKLPHSKYIKLHNTRRCARCTMARKRCWCRFPRMSSVSQRGCRAGSRNCSAAPSLMAASVAQRFVLCRSAAVAVSQCGSAASKPLPSTIYNRLT